jgi:1A family penicillin-binding protein
MAYKKRGRPRKSFFFHLRKNVSVFFKKTNKNWNKYLDQAYDRGYRVLRKVGFYKKRGRPRKTAKVVQRFFLNKKSISKKIINYKKFFSEKYYFFKKRILIFFGVLKKPGRPRKTKKKYLRFFNIRFSRAAWNNLFSLFFTVLIIFISWFSYDYVFKGLPSVLDLTQKKPLQTTRILDRNGRVLFRIYEDENRTLIPLSSVSPHLIQATIAIEDKDFYSHHGFSLTGITRAVLANSKEETIQQGGSTITQQLVKNRLLSPERTIQRKIRELILSIVTEGVYNKDEILEMYLNQVPYGGSTYGAEEAAWRYFNKSARDLTLAEAALLAGLPAAPSVYSPFGSNPELAFSRQEEVLRRMLEDGYISEQQFSEAKKMDIVFAEDKIDIEAPHFVMYVKKLLAEKYGEDVLQTAGFEVRTTLDLDLQKEVEDILEHELDRLKPLNVGNGAALVTHPQTGEILAMVGSKNYFDFSEDGQVNVVLRPRQPGSSIKPLTYAVALENGKTPASIIDDSPVIYQSVGSPPYAPQNYDGRFHGRVTLRESLASSYNIPAVKTLAEIGVNNLIDVAEKAGITTWKDRSRFGLSLTLGGGEVTMYDLSQVYGSFANGGSLVELNPLLEIHTSDGKTWYENDCAFDQDQCLKREVFKSETAYLISDILSDNAARTPAFGPYSVLNIPNQEVAVKTGTTNSLRDNWTVGYTTDKLVAVWVGNNDNTPMSNVASGITGASPIWNKVIRLMLDDENPHEFQIPENLIELSICKTSGTLPCNECPVIAKEIFVKGEEPKNYCNANYFLSPEERIEREKLGGGGFIER